MTRIHRQIAAALSLAALEALMVACSAAPTTEPPDVSTSQSITCQSDGIHVDTVCSSPPVVTGKCTEGAACTSRPYTEATYEAPMIPGPVVGPKAGITCVPDDGFAEQLAAMGCTPTRVYIPDEGGILDTWYMSWCPRAPSDTQAVWAVIDGCNQCTGEPPQSGWVLVGWVDSLCGAAPSGGCTSKNCLLL